MVIGMPRPLRIEYPGAIYHVINRGNQRQNIFRDDADRLGFVSTLVDEELRRLDWTEKELEQRPKGDKQKVETARMLRQQAGCSEWAIRNSRLPFCRLANPFQQS